MQIEHSEFQDQLVRGLAHRMNNILTLFHGYLGLLMDNQKLDKETRDGLSKIKDGAREDIKLNKIVPVIWVYLTGWANGDGMVNFRDDVYGIDNVGEATANAAPLAAPAGAAPAQ